MPISIRDGIVDKSWVFAYDGEDVTLHVEKPRYPHTLHIANRTGFRRRHPWETFFRILNEFAWYYGVKVKDLNGAHGKYSANANFLPDDDSYAIRLPDFKQQVFKEAQHLALGFFREGMSSGSAYYAFLCYAKILEIPFKDGTEKGIWIDESIQHLESNLAVSMRDRRIDVLGGKTLGLWLQKDGRNALSHAKIQSGKLVRDPNSYRDWNDIKWGNTVMRELAEKVIVEELSVARRGN